MNLSKIEQLIIESNPKEIKWVTLERIVARQAELRKAIDEIVKDLES